MISEKPSERRTRLDFILVLVLVVHFFVIDLDVLWDATVSKVPQLLTQVESLLESE